MRLPPKLTHGDNLANLFEKYNELIDYLRENRLAAGPGVRINHIAAGISIESTATATGGSPAAPAANNHPFDVRIINNGTEASPSYYARIYNSALPDSPYAGVVEIASRNISVPVAEVQITTDNYFYVDIVITYNPNTTQFSISFQVRSYSVTPQDGATTYRKTIAMGKVPDIDAWQTTDIEVTGRWF